MARMRQLKKQIKQQLMDDAWHEHVDDIAKGGIAHVGPLFAMLLLGPLVMHRAAVVLGATCAQLAEHDPDLARNVIRRFMWHMNEESGNIGWGIPESFAESLARSELLAKEYHRILLSYIMDTQQEDNYCDNNMLRRSCFWAVGRLAQARPELCGYIRPWLVKGLKDVDIQCRGMAAWALGQLPVNIMDVPFLRQVADAGLQETCILFDGKQIFEKQVSEIARISLGR